MYVKNVEVCNMDLFYVFSLYTELSFNYKSLKIKVMICCGFNEHNTHIQHPVQPQKMLIGTKISDNLNSH